MKKCIFIFFIICLFYLVGCTKKETRLFVTYHLNNGNRDITEEVKNIDEYEFIKTEYFGYTFKGYFLDSEYEIEASKDDLYFIENNDNNIDIYLKWSKNRYVVKFKCEGSVINTQLVNYLEDAIAPKAKEIAGYRFMHWDKDYTTVTNDMEVNAVYAKTNEKNVLVVLGNWMNDNGTISMTMRQRLNLAVDAYKDFNPSYIVVSGGMANAKAGISEADAMYNYLVEKGIDKDIIIKEDKSMSTYQNAIYSLAKLEDINFKNLIIVSTIEHFISYQTIKYFNDAAYQNEKIREKNIIIMMYTNNNPV